MESVTEEANKSASEPTNDTVDETLNKTPNSRIMFRWKGKIVKESTYRHRLAMQEAAKKRKLDKLAGIEPDPKIPVEGRRIVDLALLAKHLKCASCKEILSLADTQSETRRGLASILHVKCHGCDEINCVPTSKQATNKDSKSRLYSVNCDIVDGAAGAGIARDSLNKLFASLDIPQLRWKLFQRYKHETTTSETGEQGKSSFSVDAASDTAETGQNTDDIQRMLADFF